MSSPFGSPCAEGRGRPGDRRRRRRTLLPPPPPVHEACWWPPSWRAETCFLALGPGLTATKPFVLMTVVRKAVMVAVFGRGGPSGRRGHHRVIVAAKGDLSFV